jgi:hypothetical protein
MEDGTGQVIYRAMREENGMPMIGSSAEKLGIRRRQDIIPDQYGMVHRPRFLPGQRNGLWCAPRIQDLPAFILPRIYGGTNPRTVVWRIDLADLGTELVAQEDSKLGRPTRHISIGPARDMTFDEYVKQIDATRTKWKKVVKN